MRRDQVLHGSVRALDERGGDPVCASRHQDGLGAHLDAVGVGDVHPSVHLEQCDALPVDRDLDLLECVSGLQRGAPVADHSTGGLVVERDAEDVLTVGREIVEDRRAAAGAERRAVYAFRLRHPARDPVL